MGWWVGLVGSWVGLVGSWVRGDLFITGIHIIFIMIGPISFPRSSSIPTTLVRIVAWHPVICAKGHVAFFYKADEFLFFSDSTLKTKKSEQPH